MNSNTRSYLLAAGNLIKGDLADVQSEIKSGNEKKGGIQWKVLTNLITYAQVGVFMEGYTKKLAKSFRNDLMAETTLSEKQAAKYTESISAALGVRGVRKGIKSSGIEGLGAAAADGPKAVGEFLKALEIDTFNKFVKAVRVEKTPVQIAAAALGKLNAEQRKMALEMAEKNDQTEGDEDED
jgi:hypothetical protein